MQRTQLRRYSRFRRPFWKACFKCSNPFLPKSYMAYDDTCKKQMNHYTLSMVVNVLSYISSICLSERKKFSHSFMTRLRNCGSFFICLIVHSQTIRHLIPCFFQFIFYSSIASDIIVKFFLPEFKSRFWYVRILTAFMAMPEASMYKKLPYYICVKIYLDGPEYFFLICGNDILLQTTAFSDILRVLYFSSGLLTYFCYAVLAKEYPTSGSFHFPDIIDEFRQRPYPVLSISRI